MTQLIPVSAPAGCRTAAWRDFGTLLYIGFSVQILAVWKARTIRWLIAAMLGMIVLMVGFVTLMNPQYGLVMGVVIFALLVGTIALAILILTIYRLIDRRRLIFISTDGKACVDVVFRKGRSPSLRNHARAFGSTSSHEMRAAIKEWVSPMIGEDFVIDAQNDRVARMYMDEFPELHRIGSDWMGHPRLGIRRPE